MYDLPQLCLIKLTFSIGIYNLGQACTHKGHSTEAFTFNNKVFISVFKSNYWFIGYLTCLFTLSNICNICQMIPLENLCWPTTFGLVQKQLVDCRWLTENESPAINNKYELMSFIKQTHQTFSGFSLSDVRICCFFLICRC